MEEKFTPKQATLEVQEMMQEMLGEKETELVLSSGRKVKIGWILSDTQDKLDDLIVEHDKIVKAVESDKISITKANSETRKHYSKAAAAILINNYFGLKLFWWAKWRIIHHLWKMSGKDFESIMAVAKKKAAEQPYLMGMAYLMSMADIWTMMTKQEAEAFRQGLKSASEHQS